MSILIKGIPLCGYEISIMKDGERYRARVDGIWCEVEEIPTTEPDTDTISRQAAIDIIEDFPHGDVWNVESMEEMVDRIKQLPPIQPKRGRWISADAIFGGVPFYCSECGENTRDTVMGEPRWNFCPNCGAKMEVTT